MQPSIVVVGLVLLLSFVAGEEPTQVPNLKHGSKLEDLKGYFEEEVVEGLEKLSKTKESADKIIKENITNSLTAASLKYKTLVSGVFNDPYFGSYPTRDVVGYLVRSVLESGSVKRGIRQIRGSDIEPLDFEEDIKIVTDIVYDFIRWNITDFKVEK